MKFLRPLAVLLKSDTFVMFFVNVVLLYDGSNCNILFDFYLGTRMDNFRISRSFLIVETGGYQFIKTSRSDWPSKVLTEVLLKLASS